MKKLFFLSITCFCLASNREEYPENIFLAPSGTIIHASRDSGFAYLATLALMREDELCLIYLPQKQVWIPVTQTRNVASAKIDLDLLDSIISTNTEIELWHNHSDVGIRFLSEEDSLKSSLYYLMPSTHDLFQVYYCLSKRNDIKVSGIVVSAYGAIQFQTDSSILTLTYGDGRYLYKSFETEAGRLQNCLEYVSPNELENAVEKYRGMFSLRFEHTPN